MSILIKSHISYLKERYLAILKELNHFQDIASYYHKLTEEHTKIFEQATSNGKKFRKKIIYYYKESEYSIYSLERCSDITKFIFLVDIQNMKLEELINEFSALHKKLLQSVHEVLPQHVPNPSINKRYASKVLSDNLNVHVNNLYKFLNNEASEDIYLYWEHSNYYELDKYETQSIFNDNKHGFISYSFYYHDIVWSIPTLLDREVILHAVKSNAFSSEKANIRSFCKNNINNIITIFEDKYKENTIIKDYCSVFRNMFTGDDFVLELMSDMIAVELYGETYILSFFHETLGLYCGRETHLEESYLEDKKEYKTRDTIKDLNDAYYYGRPNRDTLIVRQYLILQYYASILAYNKDKDELSYIYDSGVYLQSIINPPNQSEDSTPPISVLYSDLMYEISKVCKEQYNALYTNVVATFKNNTFESPFFTTNKEGRSFIPNILWEERFKSLKLGKIHHKSILRKNMLKNHLNMEKPLLKPYTLEFTKTLQLSSSTIACGLFNEVIITPKDDEYYIDNVMDIMLDEYNAQKTFTQKHSLLKLQEYKKGYEYNFTLTMLVTFKSSIELSNLTSIDEWCINYGNRYNIDYYKSLGQEDIVLSIKCKDSNDVWMIMNKFRSMNSEIVAKTYSIVTIKNNSTSNSLKLYLKAQCTTSNMKSVEEIATEFYNKCIESPRKVKQQVIFYDTIGMKTYEINFSNVSINDLLKYEKLLVDMSCLDTVEYFFYKKI